MLTIGEFSRICFVTKKTLRHYDEIGLLRPEHTADNGYRYYTVGQMRTMLLISRLKSYGLSLPEIAAALAEDNPETLAATLADKRRRIEAELSETARVLRQMELDIEKLKRKEDIMKQNISVKTVELAPQTVYGIRCKMEVNSRSFGELYGRLFHELGQKKLRPAGPPMAFYYDEEFDDKCMDIEVAVPVAGQTADTREVPGGLHCMATLLGPYIAEEFTATYAGLMKWVEDNGYRVANAPFDRYVRGGEDCPPAEYVTEIYFPIAK